jgi:hypothetical protein
MGTSVSASHCNAGATSQQPAGDGAKAHGTLSPRALKRSNVIGVELLVPTTPLHPARHVGVN